MGEFNMARVRSLISERNSASKRATLLRDERDILKAENARLRARLDAVREAAQRVLDTANDDGVPISRLAKFVPLQTLDLLAAALSNEGGGDG
jgi:hypothetical protein